MRRRLVVALVGIAALAIASFLAPLALAERSRVRDAVDLDIRRDADRIAAALPATFPAGPAPHLALQESDLAAAVYAPDGRRVAGAGPATADRVVRDALTGRGAVSDVGTDRVDAEPVLHAGRVVGAVRTAVSRGETARRTRARLLAVFLQGLAVLALAAAVAALAARRLARPVTALTASAVRLGHGDFDIRFVPSGVAELDESGAALTAAAARLGALLERERAFSADVSHQLRTPITSLRATLETERVAPRPDPATVLQEALADVDRLEATVAQLLALSRDAPSDRQALPTAEILEHAVATWRPRLAAGDRPLRLAASPDLGEPAVIASRSAVEQILDVLLSNAVVHGTGAVTVSAAREAGGTLAVAVADEGSPPALPSGDLAAGVPRRAGSAGGTGIGLALAARLARAEGGLLALVPGPTTQFRLTLPGPDGLRADRRPTP